MCEENKLEKENEILVKYFVVKGLNLKGCRRTVTLLIGVILTTSKGGGTGPAGPVLAGPLFQRASKTFEQTKKQMHGKQILILATRT